MRGLSGPSQILYIMFRSEPGQRVERPEPRAEQVVESVAGGGMVYDVLIMLLVAAIAALLFRRINLMGQETPE